MGKTQGNIPNELYKELKALADCNEVYKKYKGSSYLDFPKELCDKLVKYDRSDESGKHVYIYRSHKIIVHTYGGEILDIWIEDGYSKYDEFTGWVSVEDKLPTVGSKLIVKVCHVNNGHTYIYKNIRYGTPRVFMRKRQVEENVFFMPNKYCWDGDKYDKELMNVTHWCYMDDLEV